MKPRMKRKRCELKRIALEVEMDNEKAITSIENLSIESQNFAVKLNNKTFLSECIKSYWQFMTNFKFNLFLEVL